jgi:hypothetical protein
MSTHEVAFFWLSCGAMPLAEAQGLQAMRLSAFRHPPNSSETETAFIELHRQVCISLLMSST